MRRFLMACAVSCVIPPGIVLAQTPADIKGNWMAKSEGCGDLKLKITSQSKSGILTGRMECVRTGSRSRPQTRPHLREVVLRQPGVQRLIEISPGLLPQQVVDHGADIESLFAR